MIYQKALFCIEVLNVIFLQSIAVITLENTVKTSILAFGDLSILINNYVLWVSIKNNIV